MKTISIKADEDFDTLLNQLSLRLQTTRSAVIRKAVRNYQKQLEKEAIRQQIRAASAKTRDQALQVVNEFQDADDDGL